MARALQVIGIAVVGLLVAGVVLIVGPSTEIVCGSGRAWDQLAENVEKGLDLSDDDPLDLTCDVPSATSWTAAIVTFALVVGALLVVTARSEPPSPTTGWPAPRTPRDARSEADPSATTGAERPRWTTAAQRQRSGSEP